MSAWLAAQATARFAQDDRHHAKRCHRISPPPSEKCVETQSAYQDHREIGTNIALVRIGVQCVALKICGRATFGSGEQWHDDNAGGGVNDSKISHTRRRMCEQMLERFEADVNSESKKANAHQSMREGFSIFRSSGIAQSPHEYQAGSNFDHRIDPETAIVHRFSCTATMHLLLRPKF